MSDSNTELFTSEDEDIILNTPVVTKPKQYSRRRKKLNEIIYNKDTISNSDDEERINSQNDTILNWNELNVHVFRTVSDILSLKPNETFLYPYLRLIGIYKHDRETETHSIHDRITNESIRINFNDQIKYPIKDTIVLIFGYLHIERDNQPVINLQFWKFIEEYEEYEWTFHTNKLLCSKRYEKKVEITFHDVNSAEVQEREYSFCDSFDVENMDWEHFESVELYHCELNELMNIDITLFR